MKNLTVILIVLLFSAFVLAQEKPETEKKDMHKHIEHMKSDSTMHGMHHDMDMKSDSTMSESIVREGEIDLNTIDENGDGKVFQDMMDWNVISDEAGTCPLCGMTLKEVTLEKAKENLVKFGFKVKEK